MAESKDSTPDVIGVEKEVDYDKHYQVISISKNSILEDLEGTKEFKWGEKNLASMDEAAMNLLAKDLIEEVVNNGEFGNIVKDYFEYLKQEEQEEAEKAAAPKEVRLDIRANNIKRLIEKDVISLTKDQALRLGIMLADYPHSGISLTFSENK